VSFSLGDGVVGVELIMVEGIQLNVKPNDLRVVGAATSARLLVLVYVSLHLPPAHISNLNLHLNSVATVSLVFLRFPVLGGQSILAAQLTSYKAPGHYLVAWSDFGARKWLIYSINFQFSRLIYSISD
jgi:hypothetical protein